MCPTKIKDARNLSMAVDKTRKQFYLGLNDGVEKVFQLGLLKEDDEL